MMQPLPRSAESPAAPHPTLRGHYADDAARPAYIRGLFDASAGDYDFIVRLMSLGTGEWYRRQAFARAGLARGMRVLDVGAGTGISSRAAAALNGDPARIVGVDPSPGMLARARESMQLKAVRGLGESLPFADGSFDFVSMSYALRHVGDLAHAFDEFRRVLRPGGTLLLLEITPPRSGAGRAACRVYFKSAVPLMAWLATGNRKAKRLMEYYWDTMESCVPPETVLDALRRAGFSSPARGIQIGIFSEYTASA